MRKTEPTELSSGSRVEWSKSFNDYSAADYDLQYRFRGPGPGIDVDATASGSAFSAVIDSAASAIMVAGRYRWQAWVTDKTDPGNTFKVADGFIMVEAGYAADDTADVETRTPARICLDTIDAKLLESAGSDIIEYEIATPSGSRKVKRRSDLLDLRKYWALIVSNEEARAKMRRTGIFGTQVAVRMP